MKNILLPTDFSEPSYNAMDYALRIFDEEPCNFFVLHTYTPVVLYTSTVYETHSALDFDLEQLYKNNALEKVHAAIDRLKTITTKNRHTFKALSAYNVLSVEVDEVVEEYGMDCIVMGTQGASGLKEVFVGSQTMQVIKQAKVPVIGVPAQYAYEGLKDVLFATDYLTGVDLKGLPLLRSLCTEQISRLIFLNVYFGVALSEKQQKNKKELDAYFKKVAHLNEMMEKVEVLEAIDQFQSKHKIDLLVLVHNKHNFFENLLFTPIVKRVVHHSQTPFMILPPVKMKTSS
ncbi:universal stress protein [Croceiramulus getboli]|nr:universal stress protein [Flavobacteriaceae bacterium YJPT1-3]